MAITYPINYLAGLEDGKRQSTRAPDRKLSAIMAAYHAFRNGQKILGELRGEDQETIQDWFDYEISSLDVPIGRANIWVDPVPLAMCETEIVGDIKLDPYQIDIVKNMNMSGHVLSVSCGLGKTVTAIAAALQYKLEWEHDRLWVACPRNAFGAWERYRDYLEEKYYDFQIVSIDSLHKCTGVNPSLGGTIIFDEVHLLGISSSKRTKLAHSLRACFDCSICLTGTLLHGGLEKSLSVLDLAVPGGSAFASKWTAGSHFKCLVKKPIGGRVVTAIEKPRGEHQLRFAEYLSRLTIAINTRTDVIKQAINLPEQHIHRVDLGRRDISFGQLVANYIMDWKQANQGQPIPHMQHVAHALARAGLKEKLKWLDKFLEEKEPSVIFAAYLNSLDGIEEMITERGLSYVRIDGSVTGQKRIHAVNMFQAGEVDIFLGQMDAACTSIDLYKAWRSVAVDHSWKATNYDQALARTRRRGQKNTCHHYDLTANQLQDKIVDRVQAGMTFDASVAEWQEGKHVLEEFQ